MVQWNVCYWDKFDDKGTMAQGHNGSMEQYKGTMMMLITTSQCTPATHHNI
jgi:hypothetical protein